METILPPEQYAVLWWSSWQPIVTGSYAVYRGRYDLAFVSYLVMCTSLQYWRYPTRNSWSRTLDVTCSHGGLVYHLLAAYFMDPPCFEYYIVAGLGVGSYLTGVELYKQGVLWPSTLCHMTAHILGNIASLVMYSQQPTTS